MSGPQTQTFFCCCYIFSAKINTKIYMDMGTGNHRTLLPISNIASKHKQEYFEALLGLHVLSACDSVSFFVSKRKVIALNAFQKHTAFQEAFCALGSPALSTQVANQLEHYVCCLYGRPKFKDINQARFELLKQKFNTGHRVNT